MYKEFYGFEEEPFRLTPDSAFFFESDSHTEAMGSLLYGIEERKGFVVITGEIGAGKTTLCRALIHHLSVEKTRIALVFNPSVTELELLRAINQEFGLETQYNTKKELLDDLNAFLLRENAEDRNVVVLVDEAQNLSPALLEELRLLSNLETEKSKLLQIVLVGQPELGTLLDLPQLKQLNQRVAVRSHLSPLRKEEVVGYVEHRLKCAHPEHRPEFTDDAFELIYQYSEGVPRKINLVCDRALLAGYVESSYTVTEEHVQKAIEELRPAVTPSGAAAGGEAKRGGLSVVLFGLSTVILVCALIFVFFQTQWLRGLVERIPILAAPLEGPTQQETSGSSALEQQTVAPVQEAEPTHFLTPVPGTWFRDEAGFIRVGEPGLSYYACVLNWLELWGYELDVEGLNQVGMERLKRATLRPAMETLGLKIYEAPLPLGQWLVLNQPLLVELGEDSRYFLLHQLRGEQAILLDPYHGSGAISVSELEQGVKSVELLYFDKEGLQGLAPGQEHPALGSVQQLLKEQGFYDGEVSGVFDRSTRQALRRFERYCGLEGEGSFSPAVLALLGQLRHEAAQSLKKAE